MLSVKVYIELYYSLLLIITLLYFFFGKKKTDKNTVLALIVSLVIILLMGFREMSGAFGDTGRYVNSYDLVSEYPKIALQHYDDYGFGLLTQLLAYLHNPRIYLIVLAVLYVIPLLLVFKNKVNEGNYVLLLLTVCSFSFFGFGTNGLRNGLATTFLIVAFLNKNLLWQVVFCVLAFSMHKSALLPIVMFYLAHLIKRPKFFIFLWMLCVVVSLFTRDAIQPLIDAVDLINNDIADSAEKYIESSYDDFETNHFSRSGYRWDFLLYSIVPIALGYYYIFKKNYRDRIYEILFCTYVACNAVWLFTIHVPYNNRFAYLSWFLYPILLAYPLLKEEDLIPKQRIRLKWIVLINYAFTYLMHFI